MMRLYYFLILALIIFLSYYSFQLHFESENRDATIRDKNIRIHQGSKE